MLGLVVITLALIVVGSLILLSLGKPCKDWKVIAKAKVVSKIAYVSGLVFYATILTIMIFANNFNVPYLIAISIIGILLTWNNLRAEIAEEGILIGRVLKVCIPWTKVKRVEINGNLIKAGRLVLKVENVEKDLRGMLKL